MNILYYESPAPHIIIDDFYNTQELKDVWKELDFLTNTRTLLSPEQTDAAKNDSGEYIKKNTGVFLDSIFNLNLNVSNIVTYNRKIFKHPTFLETTSSSNYFFRYLLSSTKSKTLVSYYENSDYYAPHYDTSTLTACTWLFKEPKQFSGGNFFLSEHDYKIDIQNNRTIILPSIIMHSVEPVIMNSPDTNVFSGNGRYVISSFIYNACYE